MGGGLMKVTRKDVLLCSRLRENGRETLTRMSRKTGIPVSTLYDRMQVHKGGLIKGFTSLIDFTALGYAVRANLLVKANYYDREKIRVFLEGAYCANTVQQLNNAYDFIAECVFRSIDELEAFKNRLYDAGTIERLDVFIVVEDVKREAFLKGPDLALLHVRL
jgi:DNA-binding Lrp family transcriptional regulator